MRRTTRALTSGAALVLLVGVPGCRPVEQEAAPDAESVRQGIEEANMAAEDLFAAGDMVAAAARIYTEDATILPPGGPVISGRSAIADFWSGATEQMGASAVDLVTDELVPLTSDAAYEIGHAVIETDGGPVEVKYVVIWRRGDDGLWRWHVDIWNEPPPQG
ncbi:MAG: DUF4440 domain-containing protein [Gemmatimonadetes bacterium]|nr:DUF4440 domain-containing protein [Gemmatimonadota bacterium]NIR81271.1 DUF4440 domain-containing protein [Gemmatimonadota bacterium]NIT86906.1 DUF4440 domain-containing protein [Gemmatimonadota bacterium]NIU33933.1 DUF4440 domain-containing protein [Gemmatimonadota bacterium]NIU38112.1 DUF4440 domain-containing protein [Gemmatimonadota bacterium]